MLKCLSELSWHCFRYTTFFQHISQFWRRFRSFQKDLTQIILIWNIRHYFILANVFNLHIYIYFSFRKKFLTKNVFNNYSLFCFVIYFLFFKFLCVMFSILLFYSILCSFFWMMIEAVYLITVIVAAYSSNKIKLWWYLIIGWGNFYLMSLF